MEKRTDELIKQDQLVSHQDVPGASPKGPEAQTLDVLSELADTEHLGDKDPFGSNNNRGGRF